MKYIITETKLERNIQKYMDNIVGDYRVLNRIWVDYDEIMNSYHINLFYDWEDAKEEGRLFTVLRNNQIREIGEDLSGFFKGIKFDIYYHVTKNENTNITESKDDYQERWSKFVTFMKRRRSEILDLIDNNITNLTEYEDAHPFTVGAVLVWTGDDIVNDNNIDPESQMRDWVYMYLEDHYTDIIKEKMDNYKTK